MKPSCAIIEDEPLARNFLNRYCEKNGMLDVKGEFASAEEALNFIQANPVDLLFLDVEMPGITGFQLLDVLHYNPKVILTTSKTDYAYTAFEYNVVDYLKKPIQYNRFEDAIKKVLALKDNAEAATALPNASNDDFFIKCEGKLIRLNYNDILFIESIGDYVKYVTAEKKYITHSTLKGVEESVDKNKFMKIHRSYVINLTKIQDIEDNSVVINKTVIPISRAHKQDVINKLKIV
jgi:DNA-binding LytR/AlgR family response regulator